MIGMDKDQKKRSREKAEKNLTKAFEQTCGSVAILKFMVGFSSLISLNFTLPTRCSTQDVIATRSRP
jgi:hypothetical protein